MRAESSRKEKRFRTERPSGRLCFRIPSHRLFYGRLSLPEVPKRITAGQFAEAEEAIQWYKNLFGDDYYLELQRHKATTDFAGCCQPSVGQSFSLHFEATG